jgi:hypothetical protein
VILNKVARKLKVKTLAIHFLKAIGIKLDIAAARAKRGTNLPEDDACCQQVTQDGTLLRCTCRCGHTGKHEYTKKGSISIRKAEELFKTLTPDEWCRLTGLDDKALELGKENSEKCRGLAGKYFDAGHERDAILERINQHETFCRTDLRKHYREVSSTHRCNCLKCGFFDTGMYC